MAQHFNPTRIKQDSQHKRIHIMMGFYSPKGLMLKESFVFDKCNVRTLKTLIDYCSLPPPLSFLVSFFKCLGSTLDKKKTFEVESCGGSEWEEEGYFKSCDSEVSFTKELSVGFWHCKCFVCLQASS